MPSFTSSSDPRRWARAWIAALVLAALALAGYENLWRARGLEPGLIDSPQSWSIQRDRIYDGTLRPVVFLGASRTVYGIDPSVWKAERPADKPLMLAVNGHYPIVTLLDLASDEKFSGLVIVDVDSYGLLAAHQGMQQPWLDYYHHQWNFNWLGHRLLLDRWQLHSVLSNPGISLWASLKRAFGKGAFQLPYSESRTDRSGRMRFDKVDIAALAAHFDAEVEPKMARFPAPSPTDFLAQTKPVVDAVERIRARGGEVVFVTLPVAGRLVEMETRYMPRADYWDAFGKLPGIHAVHYEDVPEWQALELPDRSHVTPTGRAVLTRGLMAELQRRGWLETPGK